jgi:CSLREA domain-containing protein
VLAATVPFVVTSTADTPDATQGNGVCADSQGRCTLRAAIMEANWQPGNQTISFNLPAPRGDHRRRHSGLPNLGSSTSHVFIDGYSQPGSLPNSAQFGTNAIPGVELRGTGLSMDHILYVPGPQHDPRPAARQLVPRHHGRHRQRNEQPDHRHWIGFNRDNTLPARAFSGVMLNNGASTTALAQPPWPTATSSAITRRPSSATARARTATSSRTTCCASGQRRGAACQIAIDHDFGPKNGVVGGSGPREFNVSGPTTLNGYEFSHGWDPNGPSGNYSSTWAVSGHQAIGNWIGFRADGTYDPAYLSAQNVPEVDNGQGVNLHDGAVNVTLDSNYIGAAYDGVTMQMSGTTGCILRNNIIGLSPRGQPVPMAGWASTDAMPPGPTRSTATRSTTPPTAASPSSISTSATSASPRTSSPTRTAGHLSDA